jgi:hypothetical protein
MTAFVCIAGYLEYLINSLCCGPYVRPEMQYRIL